MDIISPYFNYFKVQTFLNLVFMNRISKNVGTALFFRDKKYLFSCPVPFRKSCSGVFESNKKAVFRLTWSLPPHLPLPEFFRGLTSRIRHARRRLCVRFTWILSTVSAMDFQPQTRKTAFSILSAARRQFKNDSSDHFSSAAAVSGTINRIPPGTASIRIPVVSVISPSAQVKKLSSPSGRRDTRLNFPRITRRSA